MMRAASIVGIFLSLLLESCAGAGPTGPNAPPPAVAPQAALANGVASRDLVPPIPPQFVAVPVAPAPSVLAPPALPSTSTNITPAAAPSASSHTRVPAPDSPASKTPGVAPEIAKQKSPTLDLNSLEQRLKSTNAIGVLTKLTLKNQVDDLLDQFRAYYQGKLQITLAELRRSYELLVQKVLSLLQDSDPTLATAIVASRDAIWGILSDPKKFATI